MGDFFSGLLFFVYAGFGYHANEWIRYNLLGVQAEYTSSLLDSMFSKLLWAMLLGWISIPIWLIASFLKRR